MQHDIPLAESHVEKTVNNFAQLRLRPCRKTANFSNVGAALSQRPIGRGLAHSPTWALRGAFGKGCVRFAPLLLAVVVAMETSTMKVCPFYSGNRAHDYLRGSAANSLAALPLFSTLLSGCGNPNQSGRTRESARMELAKLDTDFSPKRLNRALV